MKEIQSSSNSLVKHLIKLRDKRAYRYEKKYVLVEGLNLLKDLSKTIPFKTLIVRKGTTIPAAFSSDEIYIVSEAIFNKLSSVQHGEGFIAEIPMPDFNQNLQTEKVLILDGLQDPGNMGTLLRTALAFGWSTVVFLEDTVDPFNEKAIRAAKGATFHLHLIFSTWERVISLLQEKKFRLFIGDLEGVLPSEIKECGKPKALLLNREASGLRREVSYAEKIFIPMDTQVESLNVAIAGGILMYSLGDRSCG